MIQIIAGNKGKGKTPIILEKVNSAIKEASGNIVYIDRNSKHMYELNRKVRLIDISTYPVKDAKEFVGFILGIISQDHDLEQIYLDGFLKIAKVDGDVTEVLKELDAISESFNLTIIVSISLDKADIAEELQDKIIVAL